MKNCAKNEYEMASHQICVLIEQLLPHGISWAVLGTIMTFLSHNKQLHSTLWKQAKWYNILLCRIAKCKRYLSTHHCCSLYLTSNWAYVFISYVCNGGWRAGSCSLLARCRLLRCGWSFSGRGHGTWIFIRRWCAG